MSFNNQASADADTDLVSFASEHEDITHVPHRKSVSFDSRLGHKADDALGNAREPRKAAPDKDA